MLKAVSLFIRKNPNHRPFKSFYAEWINTLKNTLLPLLRKSLSSSSSFYLLPTHVEMIHTHFNSYYDNLDLAASNDISQLLFPNWRNSLEIPFLWLGDLHPYLFTNLLRSFLDNKEENEEIELQIGESPDFFGNSWSGVRDWNTPTRALTNRVDQIECGLRFMVPELGKRAREAKIRFVERVGAEWGRFEGRRGEVTEGIGEAVEAEMEEMRGIFVDANRLRKNVLADIISVTDVYQAALFLEGLAQFLVGFQDKKLIGEFEKCKVSLN